MPQFFMDYDRLRHELDESARPLIYFHDDPDGVCSFLQCYLYRGEGHGIIVKSRPMVTAALLSSVARHDPDKIFVLDIALMEQGFAEGTSTPIVWVDHHPPQQTHGVTYLNPRLHGDSSCIAIVTYRALKKSLWIAAVGAIGDMQWPSDIIPEFRKQYPDLLPEGINSPRDALYNSELGRLSRIFSFVLKGSSSEAMRYVKALTRVSGPYEILQKSTSRGKFIYRRYEQIERDYQALLEQARQQVSDSRLVVFVYKDNSMAFSGDLANEMTYHYPDKLIIMGREKSGEVKCSIRDRLLVLPPLLERALIGLRGYGGGHEHASGACVNAEDFDRFIQGLKDQL